MVTVRQLKTGEGGGQLNGAGSWNNASAPGVCVGIVVVGESLEECALGLRDGSHTRSAPGRGL